MKTGPKPKELCIRGHGRELRDKRGVCHPCHLASQQRWRDTHKAETVRISLISDLKCKYGLTVEDWQNLYNKQQGRCAICQKHQSELKAKLCVDHNHQTNKVRALLCVGCNTSVGHYECAKKKIEKYLMEYPQ